MTLRLCTLRGHMHLTALTPELSRPVAGWRMRERSAKHAADATAWGRLERIVRHRLEYPDIVATSK